MARGAFLLELRQTVRGISRMPLSAGALVLLLALGIGANALIFTAVDVLLLRPLPVAHPEHLVRFGVQTSRAHTNYEHEYLYARILRERAHSFSDVFVSWPMEMSFSTGDRLESITGETVSGNYFSSLGLTTTLGRVLTEEDERRDTQVAVLSHSFWQRAFAGREDIIGQTIRLRGNSFVIVGVLRPDFVDLDLETRPDVWLTMSAGKLWFTKADNTLAVSHIYMRMRPGVSAPQAEAEVRSLYPAMLEAVYAYSKEPGITNEAIVEEAQNAPPTLTSVKMGVSAMRKQFGGVVGALMGGVAVLLLLVCSNIGGLMLARAQTKRREVAIRMSLGASRWSMMRQTLVEALLLSGVGALGGWYIARLCAPLLTHFLPARRPLGFELKPDMLVLAFVTGACLLTAVLVSIIPAWSVARTDLNSVMGRQSGTVSGPQVGRAVVIFQVAIATTLVAGGLALVRTLEVMRAQDPGFRRSKLVVMTLNPRMAGIKSEDTPQILKDIEQRAALLPGVEAVSLAEKAPMRGIGLKATVLPAGSRLTRTDSLNVSLNNVSLAHFQNMGMHLLKGRGFVPQDNAGKPRPAIVSDNFARQFFPSVDPIGQAFGFAGVNHVALPQYQIVGIVNDSKYRSMRETPPPTFYLLLDDDSVRFGDGMVLYVSLLGEPAVVTQELQALLKNIGPGLAATDVATMEQEIETSLWQERLLAALSSVFAVLSAVLAAIGLLGMLAYAVSRRRREIGIRMAMGATIQRVAKMIVRDAAWTVIPGILCGFAAYAACARILVPLLYGVTQLNVVSVVGAIALVIGVCAVATLIPALKAAQVEPWQVLREE
jgi:putative ABC transport system permease protein